jgi:putative selenium metabolism hydrolase
MMTDINWQGLLNDCVDFTCRLIQTPGMPHSESAVAELIVDEMRNLGINDVWIDEIGNVYGRIKGTDPNLGAIVLNSHTDHVDPGDLSLWPYPPYSGKIANDRIYGRGACDIKGPLAVQVYSMAALIKAKERPRRDVVFSGVVQEEIGGAGAVFWVENLDYSVSLVVLGEPSGNQLSIGHRGVLQMWVTFTGHSVHASVPERTDNPNFHLAEFLNRLENMRGELRDHPFLGSTTVAPTIIEVDTKSLNVTPAWTRVLLDFRTAAESPNSLQAFVRRVAGDTPISISDAWAEDPNSPLPESSEKVYGFFMPPDSNVLERVREAITKGTGQSPDNVHYQFATDGRHFVPYGIPIVGYSPGQEELAHTVKESISIDMMDESLKGYVQLLRDF